MKKLFLILLLIFLSGSGQIYCAAQSNIEEQKKEIIALYNSNNVEEAYKRISKIMEKDRDYEIWYLLANLSQDISTDENAVFFLKKSLLLNPEFDKAHYNLGNIYLKQYKYNSAVNEYKLAIKYKKDYPFYYYNLGCAYLGLKEYNGAKAAFKKAVSLKNDEPSFYYNLALTYKQLNKQKDAKKALAKYNELNKEE